MELLEQYAEHSSESEIVMAIVHDDVQQLANLLEKTQKDPSIQVKFKQIASLPCQQLNHNPPLISIATYFGSIQCLFFLLLMGVDINSNDSQCCTPLFYAIASDRLDFVKFLVKNGANTNSVNRIGCNLLHYCAKYETVDIAQYLHEGKYTDINQVNFSSATPFMWACQSSSINLVQYYLMHSEKPTAKTKGGWTALHYCAVSGKKEILSFLLSTDMFDINAELSDGSTPIILAIQRGITEVIDIFISYGALQSTPTDEKKLLSCNPLIAAVKSRNENMINKILSIQQIVSSLTPAIIDATLNLICTGREQYVEKELKKRKHHLDINILKIILEFISKNKNLLPSHSFEWHLYHAIQITGDLQITQLFFSLCPININWTNKDDSERTLLYAAILSKSLQIVQYLINEKGALFKISDSCGISPLSLSLQESDSPIAEFLSRIDKTVN